jgi:hypothetical protein
MSGPNNSFGGPIVFEGGLPPNSAPGPGIGRVDNFDPNNPPEWATEPGSIVIDGATGELWVNESDTPGVPDFVNVSSSRATLVLIDGTASAEQIDLPEIKNSTAPVRIVQIGGDLLAEVRPASGEAINGEVDSVLIVGALQRFFLTPDPDNNTWWLTEQTAGTGSLNELPLAS